MPLLTYNAKTLVELLSNARFEGNHNHNSKGIIIPGVTNGMTKNTGQAGS